MKDFVHLHLHSEYSLLDGALRVKDIPAAAKKAGQSAVALTDHGAMYGVVPFYEACKAEGVKPIIGCEVYVAPRSRFDRTHQKDYQGNHLVLLCKNDVGYHNLIRMVSLSFTEGFYGKPRVDMELIESYHEGLIALSACLAGYIPRCLANDEYDTAKAYALKMQQIFGNDSFYLELQDHGIRLQKQVNRQLLRLSSETGIPVVATNDVHYLKKSDAENQAILTCIQTNNVLANGRPLGFETDEFYFKSTEEMADLFSECEQAIANTVKIAEMCNFDFEFGRLILPKFDCGANLNPQDVLRDLAEKGFEQKVSEGKISFDAQNSEDSYRKRMEYELNMIVQMGYAEYFLITHDFVRYAKENHIPVGPGRGSGAGSLVSYAIGITDVDPIRYGLMFERFLNPERVSMPDFDIDFCYDRRGEVIRYVANRYGRDHVCQIITFGTLAARAVLRDVGRALGMGYNEVDAVAKLIPHTLGITLSEALHQDNTLKKMYDEIPYVHKLVDVSMALEGMPRHTSTHAAGVVIADRPVYEYVPLAVSVDTQVTQFDMDTVAKLGLLKFDFLGLRYLTIISSTEKAIREKDKEFDIEKISLEDADTYQMISEGKTLGVFQLESAGMRQLLTQLRPNDLESIVAAISLYRPGPMESIPTYLENRNHPEKISYLSDKLKDILSLTYGCIIYQEQVMQICRSLAGYSLGRADIIRRMMAKKKVHEMEREREIFVDGLCDEQGNIIVPGAVRNGVERNIALAVFDEMADFAKYAFNKSHAVSYSILAYRTAYLKAHYPYEYFASILTSVLGNDKKVSEYVAEAEKMGISVLAPSVNESDWNFCVTRDRYGKKSIRFGLLGIKNVGRSFIDAIVRERKNGRFQSFENFASRMIRADLNKKSTEGLIKSGAFDEFSTYRSQLYISYEKIIENVSKNERGNLNGQLDMFSASKSKQPLLEKQFEYPNIPEFSFREKLIMEKESTGLYFSGHILDEYSKDIAAHAPISLETVLADTGSDYADRKESSLQDGSSVVVCGIVGKIAEKSTRGGKKMLFFTLEDRYAEIEVVVFSAVLQKYEAVLKNGTAICAVGELNLREEEDPKLLLKSAQPLIEDVRFSYVKNTEKKDFERNTTDLNSLESEHGFRTLYLRVPDMHGRVFQKALNLIEIFSGDQPVVFYDESTHKYIKASGIGIMLTPFVKAQFEYEVGTENAILK